MQAHDAEKKQAPGSINWCLDLNLERVTWDRYSLAVYQLRDSHKMANMIAAWLEPRLLISTQK